MSRGGARVNSGPPPDPNALRRNREGEWRVLPASGRQGDEPKWPLRPEASPREAYLWRDLWKLPQAILWEENRVELEVALFVRNLASVEAGTAAAPVHTLVRQNMDSLMLTTPGLRSARVRIEGDTEAATPTFTGGSARRRLHVVPPAS